MASQQNIKRAGVIVHNSEDEVLMVKGKTTRKWSFPKGQIEKGESVLTCARREFHEETGRIFDGTELPVGTFVDMDCHYYILRIPGKDLEKNAGIDLSEVTVVEWHPEREVRYLDMNHNARMYNEVHIAPKYRKKLLKRKPFIDEDGWTTV